MPHQFIRCSANHGAGAVSWELVFLEGGIGPRAIATCMLGRRVCVCVHRFTLLMEHTKNKKKLPYCVESGCQTIVETAACTRRVRARPSARSSVGGAPAAAVRCRELDLGTCSAREHQRFLSSVNVGFIRCAPRTYIRLAWLSDL
jgi:hypothetical protein